MPYHMGTDIGVRRIEAPIHRYTAIAGAPDPGWFVSVFVGCLFHYDGPFGTEDAAQEHAAVLRAKEAAREAHRAEVLRLREDKR